MLKHIFAVSCMLLLVVFAHADDTPEKPSPKPVAYAKAKGEIEIQGVLELSTQKEKGKEKKLASVYILEVQWMVNWHFPLDGSDVPEFWEQAQKLNGKWVVVTGVFEMDIPGRNRLVPPPVIPVKVKTLKEAPAPKDK